MAGMKIELYNIGKTENAYVREGILDYCARIKHFTDLSVIDLPALKNSRNLSHELICSREGELLSRNLLKKKPVVLLDERGKEYTSRAFSDYLNRVINQGTRQLTFVTGGAYGFSDELRTLADHSISLSKMTLTHELARLVFLEQLYRAFTLLKGIPYHND
jgi:23S rRNA (pseudouridine1915-N3)-methyltransferase